MQTAGRVRTALVVAGEFPPVKTIGRIRTAKFVRHLESCGWKVVVLTVAPNGSTVIADPGISHEVLEELKRRGHVVQRGSAGGGYQGILIDWKNDVLIGGSEPRKDGQAVGY